MPHVVPLPHDGTGTPDDHGGDTHGVDDHSSIQAVLAGEYVVSPNMGIVSRAQDGQTWSSTVGEVACESMDSPLPGDTPTLARQYDWTHKSVHRVCDVSCALVLSLW